MLSFAELLCAHTQSQVIPVGPAFSSRRSTNSRCLKPKQEARLGGCCAAKGQGRCLQTSGLPEAAVIQQLWARATFFALGNQSDVNIQTPDMLLPHMNRLPMSHRWRVKSDDCLALREKRFGRKATFVSWNKNAGSSSGQNTAHPQLLDPVCIYPTSLISKQGREQGTRQICSLQERALTCMANGYRV